MKRYQRGLIVGKFSPLHRGHEYLINTAVAECEELVVLAYNKPEFVGCESEKKRRWFSALFPALRAFILDDSNLGDLVGTPRKFQEIPSEDDSETTHRNFVAEVYTRAVGLPLDAIFTSETYGPGFVDAVNEYFKERTSLPAKVIHREVDLPRISVPISATRIRENIHELRKFLAPEVYSDFVKRICFLGGESTGKTTLASRLAAQCGTTWATEYGRELWVEKNGKLEYEDFSLIVRRHLAQEETALRNAVRFLFVDTSPLTTLFYCEALFGTASEELRQQASRSYDYTFLCMPDIPFVQDSTRADEAFRLRQHEWYVTELARRGLDYTCVGGDLESRVRTVLEILG